MQLALPLNAQLFLGELFRLTSRRTILKYSHVNQQGRILYLPTIAHLIRANYYLKQGEHIEGISVAVTRRKLFITLEGPIQHWASRNCPRCSTSDDKEAFRRAGALEYALEVELAPDAVKRCIIEYLGRECGTLCLGLKGIENFFDHLNGNRKMHSDTRRRVHAAIDEMRAEMR